GHILHRRAGDDVRPIPLSNNGGSRFGCGVERASAWGSIPGGNVGTRTIAGADWPNFKIDRRNALPQHDVRSRTVVCSVPDVAIGTIVETAARNDAGAFHNLLRSTSRA